MDSYLLKFQMELERSNSLLEGTLQLLKNGVIVNVYRATSSFAGNQTEGTWNKRGGLLPPSSEVIENNGTDWSVSLTWRDSSNVSGVAGRYYPILPEEFQTDGDDRSYTGVHADYRDYNNIELTRYPGTKGCIGLQTERGFTAFKRDMDEIAKLGVKSIPLSVIYI
jgi:hypothetical protein